MENYIKENSKVFSQMLYDIIDTVPNTKWHSEEHKRNFKYENTVDYIRFLYDLGTLNIDRFNKLYNQYQFMIKLTTLCDRYKKSGIDCFEGKSEQLLDLIANNMLEWIHNDLDLELKKQEKEQYIRLAFSKEETASQQLSNRIAQLKEQSLRNINNSLG